MGPIDKALEWLAGVVVLATVATVIVLILCGLGLIHADHETVVAGQFVGAIVGLLLAAVLAGAAWERVR